MDPKPFTGRRAVVIGASIAGLLAARILADRFDEVVLLERDALGDRAEMRKGTPQAVHTHAMLARGLQVFEELFPGYTKALIELGAVSVDIGQDVAVEGARYRFVRAPLGIKGLGASRSVIEAELRRRVRGLDPVRIVAGHVLAPLHESGQVTGVRFQRAEAPAAEELPAVLVIDCSGRGSRSPAWLHEWGYAAAAEETIDVGICYATAYFRRQDGGSLMAVLGAATRGQPTPYVLVAIEPGADDKPRWVLTVAGYDGDHVEVSLEGIQRRLAACGTAEIAEIAARGEILGPVFGYKFPRNQRLHYERLRDFPQNYLVMGDAMACFNPAYGQGMTVAALEALALRDALAGPPAALRRAYFKAAARAIDTPWQMAGGGDLALTQPENRPLSARLISGYIERIQRAALTDPNAAGAFLAVMHMLKPPASLFKPAILWRVLRAWARQIPPPLPPPPASATPA